MLDQIPLEFIGAISSPGLLGLAVWLVLTGRIVPKATYDVMVKRGDDWQATAMKKQEIIATLAETVREQSVVSQTAAKVMSAVQEANKAGESS